MLGRNALAAAMTAAAAPIRGFAAKAAHGNNLVFLGAPGVGKGTFANKIAPLLGVPAISTGDIIRAEIKAGTPLGLKVKEFANAGKLVPDEIVSAMVRERLKKDDAKNGWILDGYPRTVQQAKDLDSSEKVSRVMNITLPEDVLITKLLGRRVCGDCGKNYNVAAIHQGELDMPPLLPKPADCDKCHGKPRLTIREDDNEKVVRERMNVYNAQTSPLIAYYGKQGKLQDFAVKKGIDDLPRLKGEMGIKA